MIHLKKLIDESGQLGALLKDIRNNKSISVFGMQQSERCLTASFLDRFIYVCPDFVSAREAFEEISCVRPDVVYLPPKDDVLTYSRSYSGSLAGQRLAAFTKLCTGEARAVVTTALSLLQLQPLRSRFAASVVRLITGDDYPPSELAASLVRVGYKRVSLIEKEGQFAVRGDIFDVFPPGERNAVRIEFFGDTVESIKVVDVETQTSEAKLSGCVLSPNTEIFYDDGEEIFAQLDKKRPKALAPEYAARLDAIFFDLRASLSSGAGVGELQYIMPLLPHGSLPEFFGEGVVVYDEIKQIVDNIAVHLSEHRSRFTSLLKQGEVTEVGLGQLNEDYPRHGGVKLAFHKITTQNRLFQPQAVYNINSTPVSSYARARQQLADDIKTWLRDGYKIRIFTGDAHFEASIKAFLAETDLSCGEGYEGSLSVFPERLVRGAVFFEQKTVLIGTYDLRAREGKKTLKRSKKDVFTLPEVGEYVVHDVHGVGVCESVSKMKLGGTVRDYIVVRYQGGDKLFLPIENIDSLSKYVATGESEPRLSKIGGADFDKVKQKVKASLKAMAFDLLRLYGERSELSGCKYPAHTALMEEFDAAFPYEETDDQLSAERDCIKDLTDGKIMDRLLCGDVGYGKTEVAMRAAYMVILAGKQVAFVSPTTILAKQHYRSVVKRMESFGVRAAAMTRFETPARQKEIIGLLKEGAVDIVCGTHRLLSKDIGFNDLGLLILDEEQRFGVEDKEKLKLLKKNVNVLTLSATPIPRTLHMSMVGIRDMSILDTPPNDRVPVQTYVSEYSDGLVADAVEREINRGGQAFIVYNRVAKIDIFAARIRRLLPGLRIAVAHGQLPEGQLEATVENFIDGGADVLLASTIIENGIDMPRANTMIVIDSDNLGLSQMYQLRGRIGRSNRLAYVFFTYDGGKALSDTAFKRLDAITQFTSFGSGFKIAMRDLEIRGAGDVLGKQQHGHMEKVGYDMYCKLLKEAVDDLRQVKIEEKREVKVFIDYDAYVPEGYVDDTEWRLKLYGRIARLGGLEECRRLLNDIKDIYGPVPKALENLVYVGLIKNLAGAVGASSVTFKKLEGAIGYDKARDVPAVVMDVVGSCGCAALRLEGKPAVVMNNGLNARKNLINFLLNCGKHAVKG